MTGKRQATYELTHDNYDDDLPDEEAGQWKPADESVLKDRPKLKARRSLANSSASDKPSLFGSFSFNLSGSSGGVNATTPTASPFGGISFGGKSAEKANGSSKIQRLEPERSSEAEASKVTSPSPVSAVNNVQLPDSSNRRELRLKEIAAERLGLLKEKDRIEGDLKKLELEESGLRGKNVESGEGKGSSVGPSSTTSNEEPELPPEEPWN